MRRIVLCWLMIVGFALAATPALASFSLNLECNHSYAIEMHGTEPSLTADAPLHYIVGIGQFTLGPQTPSGVGNGCTITHGELIYNDNDLLTYSAGPATCYAAQSLLGGGIPCFNGGTSPLGMTGSLVAGNDGGAVLSLVATEGWLDGAPGASVIPLSFNIQGEAGDHLVLGSTLSDLGPMPTSPPPGSPVLAMTMEHQHPPVTLPVTGPGPQPPQFPAGYLNPAAPPLPCTGGGCNGFGVAPYLGLTVSLFQGYAAPSADLFAQPMQGSFASTISSQQIFSNGEAGGSASFNTNDNVGNTAGATNNDCDFGVLQTGNFADGTSNDAVWFEHPSPTCFNAAAAATFELSVVQRSTADRDSFSIVTGHSASIPTNGLIVPAGMMADGMGIMSVPAGGLTDLALTTMIAAGGKVGSPKTTNGFLSFFSTTPVGCDVTASMATVTSSNGNCTLDLNGGNPVNFVVEGDTFGSPNPFVKFATPTCTCVGFDGSAASTATGSLLFSSSDCPNPTSVATSPVSVTCKN